VDQYGVEWTGLGSGLGEHFLKNRLAMPYAQAPAVIGADGQNSDGEPAASAVPMVLFQHEGKIFQVATDQWKPIYEEFAQQCKAEHDEVIALADKGVRRALAEDEHLRNGLNVHEGRLTYRAVAEALKLRYTAPQEALRI
jgi:hypothetical protein